MREIRCGEDKGKERKFSGGKRKRIIIPQIKGVQRRLMAEGNPGRSIEWEREYTVA